MKIALVGYGRMGKMIEKIAVSRGHEIVLKISIDNPKDLNKANLDKADVAIEFTGPEVGYHNIKTCIESGIPTVSGTTGWLAHKSKIYDKVEQTKGAFIYASNYSLGVNLFFALNEKLAQMMNAYPQYDVDMKEIHHTGKVDAPSGTGITLAEGVIRNIDRKDDWLNAETEDLNKVSLLSERIDPAPGTHIVSYRSPIDDIEISHTAHNREGFALGAIVAAEWLQGREGIFTMKDVLGLAD